MATVSALVQNIVTNGKIEKPKEEPKYKWDIVWTNVFVLGILHLCALYGFFIKYTIFWQTAVFFRIYGLASGFGITAGAHRLWAHRSYKASTLGQLILMFMSSMTYQNSVYIWARDHRLHHKYSETDADPHNACRGFFFSHVGWLLVRKHEEVKLKGKTLDMSDLQANPIVMFQHKYYYFLLFFLAGVVPTFIPWYFWNETLVNSFVVCAVHRFILQLNYTWGVNSFAHLYGTKPYDKSIGPVESAVMKLCSLGEGFHNYHHAFPWDYKASETSTDARNITTQFIDFLAIFGLVFDRKTVSKEMIQQRRARTGDFSIPTETKHNFMNYFYLALFLLVI